MLDELLGFFLKLVQFHQTLLMSTSLWSIQKSLVISIIDEEYCLISVLVHLLTAFKQATNSLKENTKNVNK